MRCANKEHAQSTRRQTDELPGSDRGCSWLRWTLPLTGLCALIWFLIRVIPKPSRATYPCQQAAFPLALGFVVWLIGVVGSVSSARCRRLGRGHGQGKAMLGAGAVRTVCLAVIEYRSGEKIVIKVNFVGCIRA